MTDIAKRAEAWALMSHAGRTYGNGPYTDHLKLVVKTLKRYGFAHPVLCLMAEAMIRALVASSRVSTASSW